MIRRVIAALMLLLAGTVATAQQVPFPQTLPANTVYGRLGIGAGPGQAIPFSVLTTNLFASVCQTASAVPVYNGALAKWVCTTDVGAPAAAIPVLIGGTGATSILTLRDTSSGAPTASSIKFQSAGGMTYAPTMDSGSGANDPWEFKTATQNIAYTGKQFWTTGTANAGVDSIYNCATPLTIPGQPLDQDTSFNICGTFTNATGVLHYSNMLTATAFVDGSNLDVNAILGTMVARVAGTGGAGVVGLGKAEVATAIAHGAEISAVCHANGANCTAATALLLPLGGGNGGLAVQQYVSMRSGAAANSALIGISLGDGPVINPFQDTGSSVMRAAGSHVRFDNGIDFSAATVNTCAFAAPGGFCITGVGDINTGGAASSHTGKLNLLGSSSGTITIQPQSAAGTFNFNLPITVGSAGQPLLSGGGGAAAMTWGALTGTGSFVLAASPTMTTPTINTNATIKGNQSAFQILNNAGSGASGFLVGRSIGGGDAQDFFIFDNVAGALRFTIQGNGHIGFGAGTAPSLTAGCNGAGSSVTGNDANGTVVGSTAAATTCTMTFASAYTATPRCTVSGLTSPLTGAITPSTTTLVVNFASTANYNFTYHCFGT